MDFAGSSRATEDRTWRKVIFVVPTCDDLAMLGLLDSNYFRQAHRDTHSIML